MSSHPDFCDSRTDVDALHDYPGRGVTKGRAIIYLSVLGVALLLRLLCLAHQAFYCDVGGSLAAIKSGVMHIQFPGYVIYHLSVLLLSKITSNVFAGFLVFSVVIDLLTIVCVMRAAELLGGLRAALAGGIVSSCGLLGVYFSGTGTSYPADGLAAAGVIYYGLRTIYRLADRQDILKALLWCLFGIAMRPLSSMWLLPAVVYLVWRKGERKTYLLFFGVLVLGAAGIGAVFAQYYHSWADLLSTMRAVQEAGTTEKSSVEFLTNLFRFFGFPAYFFHVWLALGFYAAFQGLRQGATVEAKAASKYLALVAAPYVLLLFKYFAHAGYLCLLGPIIILFPLIFQNAGVGFLKMAAIFAVVALVQLFVIKPVAPTSLTRCVADAYFFQYSRAGIETNTFEALALLAWKNGISVDKIPEDRIKQARQLYKEPKGEKTERIDQGK